jgi:hypothetical protein
MHGLDFMLHLAPPGEPAMTSDPRARGLPCRVIGLPPRCHGL